MANKSAALLAATIGNAQTQVEDASTALDRIEPDDAERQAMSRTGGDKAGFALPEAAVTAIGASLILGPLGGLVLGAAQGFLGQRVRQNQLDRAAAQSEGFAGGLEVINGRVNTLLAGAESLEDRELMGNYKAQLGAAQELYKTDPESGLALMGDVLNGIEQYSRDNETQRIARESEAEAARIAYGKRTVDLHIDAYQKHRNESQPFIEQQALINQAQNSFREGDNASAVAGVIQLAKAIDPAGGAVTEGDVKAWGGAQTMLSALAERAKREMGSGNGLSIDTRKEIDQVLERIKKTSLSLQQARDTAALENARDLEVPFKFWNQYSIASQQPQYKLNEMQDNAYAGEEGLLDAVAGSDTDGDGVPDDIQRRRDATSEFIRKARDKTGQTASDIINVVSGTVEQIGINANDFLYGTGRDRRAEKDRQIRSLDTN